MLQYWTVSLVAVFWKEEFERAELFVMWDSSVLLVDETEYSSLLSHIVQKAEMCLAAYPGAGASTWAQG